MDACSQASHSIQCSLIDLAICPGLNLGFSHQRTQLIRLRASHNIVAEEPPVTDHNQRHPEVHLQGPRSSSSATTDTVPGHQPFAAPDEQLVESMSAHVFGDDGKILVTWILR